MHSSGFLNFRSYSLLRQTGISQIESKIKALIQQGSYLEALESYSQEPNFPINTSRFTFPSLLKACACLSYFHYGKTLHSTVVKLGLHSDPYIVSSLVRMHIKHGSLCNAVQLFDEMSHVEILNQDVATWNSIIDGYSKNGLFNEGIDHFRKMQEIDVKPDGYTLCILLGMCNGCIGSSFGKEIHGHVVRNVFGNDPFVITALIDMYLKSSRIVDAWNVFGTLQDNRNIAVWNSMINGFCESGLWEYALELYSLVKRAGLELGSTTFSCVLTACSQGKAIDFACQLHCDIVKTGFERDPYVTTSLLTFYSKCGFIENAETIFCFSADRKVEIWNSMISAYVNCGHPNDAFNIYTQMQFRHVEPDSFTVSNILIACSMMGTRSLGKVLHAELLKKPMNGGIAVLSALLTMYSKLGNIEYARKVFNQVRGKDVVAWGSIISASCENREFKEALGLYKTMESNGVKPDASVVASVIIAYAGLGEEKLGCCAHGLAVKEGLDSDAFTGSALIEFYSKLRQPEMAKTAFSNVLQKNLVVWNSLISCYSRNGLPDVAISLLPQIKHPDSVSITTILAAIARTAALLKGKAVHGYCVKSWMIPEDTQVENALIDMYIKCGSSVSAERIFEKLTKRDVFAWNMMIAGYGSHGDCNKAIGLFHEMVSSGTRPDEVTFHALISACNHGGYIREGVNLFQLMQEYKFEPNMEHYINMVDLLGRGGQLHDAWRFIQDMKIAPDRGVWLSLLSACRVHRDVEIGEVAAQKVIEMEPGRGSSYVQVINMYVEAGMKEKAAEVRAEMRERGVGKTPGCSWIEVKDKVEVFLSGDLLGNCRASRICETVEGLKNEMKREEWDSEAEALAMYDYEAGY